MPSPAVRSILPRIKSWHGSRPYRTRSLRHISKRSWQFDPEAQHDSSVAKMSGWFRLDEADLRQTRILILSDTYHLIIGSPSAFSSSAVLGFVCCVC